MHPEICLFIHEVTFTAQAPSLWEYWVTAPAGYQADIKADPSSYSAGQEHVLMTLILVLKKVSSRSQMCVNKLLHLVLSSLA